MLNLKRLYQITSNNQMSFEQKMQALLRLGAEYYQLDLGIISEIKNDRYLVCHAISPDNSLQSGSVFSVKDTFCMHTLKTNQALSFHHAGKSHIAQHPCYVNFGLESYIGAPLFVEGERFGTINFSASCPRAIAFSQEEHDFIELLSHWTGNEIARNAKRILLQEQQKKMLRQQYILEQMGHLAQVGAWEVDLVNNKVFWSSVTRQIHEVAADFVPDLNSGINFYKKGKNRQHITNMINQAITEGGNFSGNFEIITQKGNAKWVACKGKAEMENGQCVRLIGAFQDITEQIGYGEQLENRHKELTLALEARSLFLANMSHEIRTPINGVLGMLQILEGSPLNQDQQHFLRLAKDSANALLGIISDILDFTKIDSGKLSLEKLPVNVNKLLDNCVDVLLPWANDKSITLIKKFDSTHNIVAITDPTRLRQICYNLVTNAIKFTHQGQIKITTNLSLIENNKALLSLAVSDTGIGISEDQMAQLFLPFSQADVSTTRKFGGTGLGLSISKNLCQLMHGDLTVVSSLNKGSTFTAMLEISLQTLVQTDLEENRLPKVKQDIEHLNILVVEDNEINQVVISEMLKQQHIKFDVASDGLEALALVEQHAKHNRFYSLILMDCQMPNLDGYETTKRIRQLTGPVSTIPIVALTANALPGEREKCYASGMNDYLTKPLEQSLLYKTLEKFA